MDEEHVAKLEKRLARSKAKIKQLEELIEVKFSELYEAKEAIREQGEFLDAVINTMVDALFATDPAGNIILSNNSANNVFGANEETLVGTSIFSYFSNASAQQLKGLFDQVGEKEITSSIELVATLAGGNEAPFQFSFSTTNSTDASARTFCLVGHDLRNRKKLEAKIAAQTKMEAVGHLAAGVAHEINTPSQAIQSNLDFLQEGTSDVLSLYRQLRDLLPKEGERLLAEKEEELDLEFLEEELPTAASQASDGLKRVTGIVSQLKNYSSASNQSSTESVLVQQVVDKAIALIPKEKWEGISLTCDVGDDAVLNTDENAVALVLSHILQNAAEAVATVSERERVVSIRAETNDQQCLIVIQDNGPGIPSKHLDSIFNPFFTTKPEGNGTGHGLAHVEWTVKEQLGGEVEVASKPGETLFRICIPQAAFR